MTTTTERPLIDLKVPTGLIVPQIENDLTRRQFLSGREAANGGEEASGARTIKHKYGGRVEVSGVPEWVVTIRLTDHEFRG
jgi:hypothetical protein